MHHRIQTKYCQHQVRPYSQLSMESKALYGFRAHIQYSYSTYTECYPLDYQCAKGID